MLTSGGCTGGGNGPKSDIHLTAFNLLESMHLTTLYKTSERSVWS